MGLRETAEVAFDGILLRTAGVSGRVTIDGEATSGLTVTLAGEEDRTGMTNANGQYAFSGLAAGEYTLTLSGYDADEYEFDAEMSIELELDEAAIANFEGRSLRTVVVMGTVSAEGDAMMGVTVTLTKMLSATAGELLSQMTTDEDGGYMFDELLAATYRIDITGYDDEFDFPATTRVGPVATDETATWDFDAEIIRESSVSGVVEVDGDGMADVTVTLTGDHDTDEEMETSDDGSYKFDGLRKGDYTVTMENPDEDAYNFPTTSRSVNLGVDQDQTDVSFAGSMNRRASISGQVRVEDPVVSLEGVTVKLRGEDRADTETDANGEYNFPGLLGGDYTVSMENPNEDAYIFDVTSVDVDGLGEDQASIVDFAGSHTTTASVSGMMYVDELTPDSAYTDGEPILEAKDLPMILQGPGLGEVRFAATDSTGNYTFDSLKAGTYRVLFNDNDTVKGALSRAGYAFRGQPVGGTVIVVPAATDVDVNFAFEITKQTIFTGAVLANNVATSFPVGGVRMALYPTAEDAEDGTNSLGTATTRSGTTDPNAGFATFEFDRAKDKGPGGGAIDYLVFAKVLSVSNSDLHVHNDAIVEIEYQRVDRASRAPTVAKLINTRVNFQWWVKSNATAKDGDEFLGGWKAKNGKVTNSSGKATYTGTLTASQMASAIRGTPARFSVSMDTDQADSVDGSELWRQSSSLSHSHTGLEDPANNTMANNDLGIIRITWRTQALILGVYREADDVDGFTNYQSSLPGGDHRPVSGVAREMEIKLLARDSRDRLKPYKYDHDACTNKNSGKTDPREATFTIRNGIARVDCLPANDEFTITFELGDDRVEVGPVKELRGYIEAFNQRDLTVGNGTVLGTFGTDWDGGSGGGPEVRMCMSSKGTSDDECATWAYQWETGSIVGNVGDQRGHKVHIEPTTEEHGADTASSSSGTGGAYKFSGLRDGVYDIQAYSTRTYRIRGDSTQTGLVVYHDETTDDNDTLTDYVGTAGQDSAKWTTQQLGLSIMGYIGHDRNRDKRFRGDESVAGISVSVSGGGVSKSTTTDERGFYRFADLPAGSYTVRASSSAYLLRGSSVGSHRASAQSYPSTKPAEGDVSLPYWTSFRRTSRVTNSTSRFCNSSGSRCGNLYNFGLLYTDGEVQAKVNNLSGSASGIPLKWYGRDNDSSEVTTNFKGELKRTRLTEGDYSLAITDDDWAIPMMRGSVPDDDGTRRAPTRVSASLRGKDAFGSMQLYVYDAGASSDDAARSGRVSARQDSVDAGFNRSVSWSAGWVRASGTETTSNADNLGTISWKSESVRLSFSRGRGATYELKNGFTACTSTTCTLSYNRTGSSSEGEARENTLNLTVTAANGYDDHVYSLKVSRAAPVGNDKVKEDFLRIDRVDGEDEETFALGTGDGKSVHDAFTMETKGPSGSSLTMRIALEVLGVPGEGNAYCAQSVLVQEYNDTDTVKSLNPEPEEGETDPYEDDDCRDTRYRLQVPELYEFHVRSEDGVAETYYLSTRNRDRSGSARLASLDVDDDAVTLTHPRNRTDTTFMEVVENADTVTVEWELDDPNASVRVSPRDTDSDEDGHQLALGERDTKDTLTIRVVAENREDTAHYGLVVKRANNVATLATLSPINDDETFDAATTSYNYDVANTVSSVSFTFTKTDSDATTDSTSGDTWTLGDAGTDTDVEIVVTAEDEVTSQTYTVTVSRAADPPDPTAGVVLTDMDDAPFSEEMTEGATDTVQVALATEPTEDSSVIVTVTPATGITVGTTSLTFTDSNWDTEQELVLTAAIDEDAEPTDVDLTFTFAGDTVGGYHQGDTTTVNVAIIETDTKGVNLSATAKEVNEGAIPGTYTVALNSQPVGGNVNIEISGEPDDVNVDTNQLTFTAGNWQTGQTVTITPTNDDDTASHASFNISSTVLGGGYTGIDVDDVTIQVLDDEASQVVITTTAVTVKEDSTFQYTILLTDEPSSGETVTVDLSYNTADFSADQTSVALTSSNYAAGVTITVTVKSVDADATKTIRHNVSVADTDTSTGSETVYDTDEEKTASSVTVTVKNGPE